MLLLTRMLFGEHDEPQRRDDAARKDDER
jgi:hypothetical protein